MKKSRGMIGILILIAVGMVCISCTHKKGPLDPENPVTISIWHYYNGTVKNQFDSLVTKFNETVGMEQGVLVDAQSYGDVNELADAVYRAADKSIGAQPMPDIFAAYPDNAFRVNKIIDLVNLEAYFTKEELSLIRQDFLEEGRFGTDNALMILPIAKSSENLYLNRTYWDKFAKETGASLDDLSTWEGLIDTARQYYEHTGKAFFCIDSNANFMLLASKQLGEELYTYQGNNASMNLGEEAAFKIWNTFYVPYINGYFAKSGRFSSDDAKTGKIIAYAGSTAGASYFPTEITDGDTVVPVEVNTLPYPYFEGGEPYAIAQGAGMCIVPSDKAHEFGAALFLKWFTEEAQNIKFAVSTAYFPVKSSALKEEVLLKELSKTEVSNEAIKKSISTTLKMFETHKLYGNRPFEGSYDMRKLLENHLFQKVNEDSLILETRVARGEDRATVIQELSSNNNFQSWYQQFITDAELLLSK